MAKISMRVGAKRTFHAVDARATREIQNYFPLSAAATQGGAIKAIHRGRAMSDENWNMHFKQFSTRSEVRGEIVTNLAKFMEARPNETLFPVELSRLHTATDREVMESYGAVKSFCDGKRGNDRRSQAAVIGGEVRELFSKALERMKELPPETVKRDAVVGAVRLVRRS
jgi:hypothetical protein